MDYTMITVKRACHFHNLATYRTRYQSRLEKQPNFLRLRRKISVTAENHFAGIGNEAGCQVVMHRI